MKHRRIRYKPLARRTVRQERLDDYNRLCQIAGSERKLLIYECPDCGITGVRRVYVLTKSEAFNECRNCGYMEEFYARGI